jgi:hypothetical protein
MVWIALAAWAATAVGLALASWSLRGEVRSGRLAAL